MTTLYTPDHEWLRIEGDVATIGITDYAQTQLGDVVEVNDALIADPALINSDPGKAAWFFKLRIANKSDLDGLMDEAAYKAHTA